MDKGISLVDILYLITIIAILVSLVMRKGALWPSVIGLVTISSIIKGDLFQGLVVSFNAVMAATVDLLNIIMTIAFVVMMNKVMGDAGTYKLMISPLKRFLHNPYVAYWVMAISCVLFGFCIRATPTVVLVGTFLGPLVMAAGMPRLAVGMILAIYGKGITLSGDFITQGTANMTAKATNLPVPTILNGLVPVWGFMAVVSTIITTIIAYKMIRDKKLGKLPPEPDTPVQTTGETEVNASLTGHIMAFVMPLTYLIDIYALLTYKNFNGGNAISLIGGTTLLLTIAAATLQYKMGAFNKLVEFSRDGWAFAFKVFGPVVIIAGLFWLGGDHISKITGIAGLQGLTYDWGYWLANHVTLNVATVTAICMIASGLAAFDGSGFAAIPLGATLAVSLGTAIGANITYMVAGAVMAAIWTGATLVPWGFLAVSAAMAGVDAQDLARKNLLPCGLSLVLTYLFIVLVLA